MDVCDSVKEWLLEHGCDLDGEEYLEYDALFTACINESNDILEQLVQGGVDINSANCQENTVLHLLCDSPKFNDERTRRFIEIVLKFGANVNARNQWEQTPLMQACGQEKKMVIELILQRGADVNCKDQEGNNAMQYAIATGKRDVVGILLKPDVHFELKEQDCCSYLKCVCTYGFEDIALMLLEWGIACNLDKGYAFQLACSKGYFGIVKLFLEHGFNLGEFGSHAIYSPGNEDVANLILDYGVEIDAGLLFKNATRTGFIVLLEVLVRRGIDINEMFGNVDVDSLFERSNIWDFQPVKCLLDCSVDVNSFQTFTGMNTLMFLCQFVDGVGLTKLLINKGVDLNAVDNSNRTALGFACLFNRYEVVKLLIEYKVDVNLQGGVGKTALMMACVDRSFHSEQLNTLHENVTLCENKLKIVDLLIMHGASIDMKDNDGKSAIFYAVERKSTDNVAQKLIDSGANLELIDNEGCDLFSFVLKRSHRNIEILYKNGLITNNNRLKTKFKYGLASVPEHGALKQMMILGIFEWELCKHMDVFNIGHVILAAMDCGVNPGKILAESNILSPLVLSILTGNFHFTNVLVRKLYFYPEDYTQLCSSQLDENYSQAYKDWKHNLTHRPMTLFKWSFITVSKAISLAGSPCSRKERVEKLEIPRAMKTVLSFE